MKHVKIPRLQKEEGESYADADTILEMAPVPKGKAGLSLGPKASLEREGSEFFQSQSLCRRGGEL